MPIRRLIIAIAALAMLAIASAAPAQAHAATCARASAATGQASMASIRRSTLCLLNVERAKHGLPALKPSMKLRRASERHSRDMVARHYFAHGDFFGRIEHSGYLRGVHAYTVGENIAWGGGPTSSPATIVRMWMNSPPHRANILNRAYRHIGIGVVAGTPARIAGGTYTTDFGFRR